MTVPAVLIPNAGLAPALAALADSIIGGDVVLLNNAGTPTNGTSGTGATLAGKGSLCVDTTNALVYINTNTKASPTWGLIASLVGLTATAAELNVLHSVVAGTARASSALVLGAGLSATGVRRPRLTKTASYPLVVGDSGAFVITNPTATDITLTLPAAADGVNFKILNIGTGSATGLTIAPAGTEKVFAKGITAAAGKGLINTFATEAIGDAVDIWSDGTDWFAILTGTWARVA